MNKIRTVVAGVGGRGLWAVREVCGKEDYQLAGLLDTSPGTLHAVAEHFDVTDVPTFTDVHACVKELDFDAMVICSPDGTHAEVACPVLAAGRWVYVEKPLGVTHQQLDAIIDADRAAGGKTFVGFNLRFAPVYIKLHELIEQGVAGQVLTIQADEFYDGGRTYFRRWNRLRAVGGGLWITKASHDFDLLYWMAGADPVNVYASASLDYYGARADAALHCRDCALFDDCPDRLKVDPDGLIGKIFAAREKETGFRADLCLYNSDKDTFDHGIANVTFANNVIATYTVNVVTGISNRRMRVSGTKATLDGDLVSGHITIHHRDPSSTETIEAGSGEDDHGGSDHNLLDHFRDFIGGDTSRVVRPPEAAIAVRMGLAATKASDEKCVVNLT